jgi:zinc protease
MRGIRAILICAAMSMSQGIAAAGGIIPADKRLYVVAVSRETYGDPAWRQVANALVEKHDAKVVQYSGDVSLCRNELASWMPDYICFVARPQEAGRNFVVAVARMTRKLDDDPFTDAMWGILTGYEAADALRIAKRKEPLIIRRGASGAGPGHVWGLESCFASAETWPNRFWIKRPGEKGGEIEVKPDPAEALAGGFNTMRPQVFYTSGHATDHDWQIGYRVKAGQFRHKDGQLLAINTAGKVFKIDSPEPKVYLPAGNCLIGLVSGRDCMVTAWIHSGGVYQMYGYTAVTWNGLMGWGVKNSFAGGSSLAESFYWTNQHLLRTLHEKYPQFAGIDFETYDHGKIEWLANRHKLVRIDPKTNRPELMRDPMALLWDRDCVAFYGDPAWEVRLPKGEPDWKQEWSGGKGAWTLTITPLKDDAGPGRVDLFLPERLTDVQVVKGKELVPVVTDNFIMASPRPKDGYKKDMPVVIGIAGKPMVRPRPDK